MLKLFHDATWLLAMTLSVRPAYASVTPAPPCDVLYQVRIAPRARARIAPSSMRNVIGSVCPLMTGTNSAVLTLLRSRPVATTSTSACPSSVLEQHPDAVGLRRIEADVTLLPVGDVLLIFGVDPQMSSTSPTGGRVNSASIRRRPTASG